MPGPLDKVIVRRKSDGKVRRDVTKANWEQTLAGNPDFEMLGYVNEPGGDNPSAPSTTPPAGPDGQSPGGQMVKMTHPDVGMEEVSESNVERATAAGWSPYEPPPPEPGVFEKYIRPAVVGAGQGITANMLPRAVAGVQSLIHGTDYDRELGFAQEAVGDIKEQSPGMYTAGDVAGSIGGAIGGGGLLAKGAARVAPRAAATVGEALGKSPALAGLLGGSVDAGVRSAADTPAGQDVDLQQVADDATMGGLAGGAGGAVMGHVLAPAAGAVKRAVTNPNTTLGQGIRQLQDAGGKIGLIRGAKGSPASEAADKANLGRGPAPGSKYTPSEKTSRMMSRDQYAPMVLKRVREVDEGMARKYAGENEAFYASPHGKQKIIPARFQELAGEILEGRMEGGKDLPFVKNSKLKKALDSTPAGQRAARLRLENEKAELARSHEEAMARAADDLYATDDPDKAAEMVARFQDMEADAAQKMDELDFRIAEADEASKGFDAKQFDEVIGAVDDEINYLNKTEGKQDKAMLDLAAAIREDRLQFDIRPGTRGTPIEVADGNWDATKLRHARGMAAASNRRKRLGVDNARLKEDPLQWGEQVKQRVESTIENWSDDAKLLEVANELGLEDALQPARAQAAINTIHGDTRLNNPVNKGGFRIGAFFEGGKLRSVPVSDFFLRAAEARNQARAGYFLGSTSEMIQAEAADTPRSTTDFLLRAADARRKREEEQP